MYNHLEDIITVDDLCILLHIGYNAAYTLLKSGEIKAFKIGRVWKISRHAVTEYILRQSKFKVDN